MKIDVKVDVIYSIYRDKTSVSGNHSCLIPVSFAYDNTICLNHMDNNDYQPALRGKPKMRIVKFEVSTN